VTAQDLLEMCRLYGLQYHMEFFFASNAPSFT
jgi:hypothetical protein